ncbi:MAG: TonB-dependent receptor domain-containing protein [Gemmatimonadota bacterium]
MMNSRAGTVVTVVLGAMLMFTSAAWSQRPGRVVGKVFNAASGEPIAGAIVDIEGTALRATTAIDGRYTLANVAPGTVSVRVRMVGYRPKTITGIVVKEGTAAVQDVTLDAELVQLSEITVSAEGERGSVSRALEEQRSAASIINAITAEQIAMSPDGDAGQAVQRVGGVSVQDGKFVFVRGLGERYTQTSLNGARIPSPEPDRKVVPLDLFPSGMLEAITTSKTFTPDQPGDFSGAQINLKTREFAARRTVTFSLSSSYNAAATFKPLPRAPSEAGDWLAAGASRRALPAGLREAGSLAGLTPSQINGLIGQFRNVWSAPSVEPFFNGAISASIGGEDPIAGQPIGYLASFNYSNQQDVRADETRGLAAGSAAGTFPFNTYHGRTASRSVLWGGLLNLSTRIGSGTRLELSNTFTRSADNSAATLSGTTEEFAQFDPLFTTRLSYIERSVRSNRLAGEHLIGAKNLIDWSVVSSGVTRHEPDRSDLAYQGAADSATGQIRPVAWPGQARFATRTFSELSESGWDVAASVRRSIGPESNPAFIKVGGLFRTVSRDADTRAYDILNQALSPAELALPPEQLFSPANIQRGAFTLFANANAGRYTADETVGAGFAMAEIPLSRRLRVVGGARVEYWRLDVNTTTVFGQQVPARPRKLDVLPSLALNLGLTDRMNLRFSASQTLSRPEYRELSPVPYFEQIGLLTTFGNADLRRALVQNVDARWEWYPHPGEIVSVALFGKRFTDPIEKVIVLQAGSQALTFVNAERASNYGAEVEIRRNLGRWFGRKLEAWSVFGNATWVRSDITPGHSGVSALTNGNRPMVGQSPYIVNGGVGFAPPGSDLSVTALYNVAGRRIVEAGSGGLPDAYEEARHMIDVTAVIPVTHQLSFKFEGKNLLDAPYRLTQGQVERYRWRTGRIFGAGFTWRP